MKGFIQLNRRGLLAVLMAFMMMLAIPSSVFAEEENYYPTWNSYTEEHADDSVTWNDVVDAMDLVIDTAKERYASGDADGAYKAINDAYYGYYETTGFERTAMGYISGARKSEMELQFSSCKSIADAASLTISYGTLAASFKHCSIILSLELSSFGMA